MRGSGAVGRRGASLARAGLLGGRSTQAAEGTRLHSPATSLQEAEEIIQKTCLIDPPQIPHGNRVREMGTAALMPPFPALHFHQGNSLPPGCFLQREAGPKGDPLPRASPCPLHFTIAWRLRTHRAAVRDLHCGAASEAVTSFPPRALTCV